MPRYLEFGLCRKGDPLRNTIIGIYTPFECENRLKKFNNKFTMLLEILGDRKEILLGVFSAKTEKRFNEKVVGIGAIVVQDGVDTNGELLITFYTRSNLPQTDRQYS